jgi:hypothetical protein
MSGDDPAVPAPEMPTERLAGWERTSASVERLFGVEGTDVRGHTVVYEDADLRAAVRRATDERVDRDWRFFFATRLRFRPPLPPGIGPPAVLPAVRPAAVGRFVDDLRGRGVEAVERGRSERVRTEQGHRVRLRQVTGRVAVPELDDTVPVEGWIGAWTTAGDVYVAGGASPATSLAGALGVEGAESIADVAESETDGADSGTGTSGEDLLSRPPSAYREELLRLVRAVG